LFGVGFGNYSLVRNNPNYRGVIPPTDEWDLTGLGGLATFALEFWIVWICSIFAIAHPIMEWAARTKRSVVNLSLAANFLVCNYIFTIFGIFWLLVMGFAIMPKIKS